MKMHSKFCLPFKVELTPEAETPFKPKTFCFLTRKLGEQQFWPILRDFLIRFKSE